jgi:hypothetical protein
MKINSFLLCCLVFLFACKAEQTWDARFVESDKYSFSRFIEGIQQFPYRADKSKFSRVVFNFRGLKLGMSKAEVIKLLGVPDSEMFKFRYPDDKNVVGSSYGYYLTRKEKELGNKLDKEVFLYFNKNEELYWAQPVNLNLTDLGGPEKAKK